MGASRSIFGQSITLTLVATFAISMVFLSGCLPVVNHFRVPFFNKQTAVEESESQKPATFVAHAAPPQNNAAVGLSAPPGQSMPSLGPMATLFQNINPRRTVCADPNNEYRLTEADGPFLIFAAAFSGPTAQQDAHALVLEFRSVHNWHAFVYERNVRFDAQQDFQQHARHLQPGRGARYRNQGGETEFAVFIGNFNSLDDRQIERTLAEVRKSQPESLKTRRSAMPISMAFALANPMLPTQHASIDAFVESINQDRPYSLLRNPHRYTVQIATFRGGAIVERSSNLDSINPNEVTGLQGAEQSAATLTRALRERGVQAFEFHDRHISIVTVGGFDQYQQQLPNGAVRYLPHVEQIIRQYQGQHAGRDAFGNDSFRPIVINGIMLDPQPSVIPVPRGRR